MPWQELRGHDLLADRFRRALARGKLASTFLFIGPAGIGKRAFALKLAQSVLCERVPDERLAPCGECPSCRQVRTRARPRSRLMWAFMPARAYCRLAVPGFARRANSGCQALLRFWSGARQASR